MEFSTRRGLGFRRALELGEGLFRFASELESSEALCASVIVVAASIMADMETAELPVKTVPETLLKKRKRNEQWAINRKEQLESSKAKNAKNRALIFKRAEKFINEYRGQVI